MSKKESPPGVMVVLRLEDRRVDWRTATLHLAVVSDVPLIRQSLAALMSTVSGVQVRDEVEPGHLFAALEPRPPDAVVLGLTLTPRAGPALERVVAALDAVDHPPALVVIGPHRNGLARALVRTGPPRRAFLVDRNVPDVDSLVRIVRDACSGIVAIDGDVVHGALGHQVEPGLAMLTTREYEVLAHLADGLSNQAIAARLHIAPKSVEAHVTQIFRKLDLESDRECDRRVRAARMFSG